MKVLSAGSAARAVERGRSVFLALKDDPRDDFRGLEIRRISDGAVVGSVEISRIARGNFQSAYLGYRVAAAERRQGYMTEALQLALRHAFRALKLHRVEANIEPGNEASIALVRRAGFSREGFSRRYLKHGGRWRDHERWALLREEWRPLRGDSRPGRAGGSASRGA
ncbi:MAG TPA: GNAT family protein [Gemmatimonadota bacterium]|nr:GNAT family protein [Gemmatimonadota bacterium]